MRDIRSDLRTRLEAVGAEREKLVQRLADLDDRQRQFEGVLGDEERRWHSQDSLFAPNGSDQAPVSELRLFLLETLSDGQSWQFRRIKDRALGLDLSFGKKNPGQAIHASLVAAKRRGLVDQIETGLWRIAKTDAPPAKADEASKSMGVVSGDPLRT